MLNVEQNIMSGNIFVRYVSELVIFFKGWAFINSIFLWDGFANSIKKLWLKLGLVRFFNCV